jgi:hypothetical protein
MSNSHHIAEKKFPRWVYPRHGTFESLAEKRNRDGRQLAKPSRLWEDAASEPSDASGGVSLGDGQLSLAA